MKTAARKDANHKEIASEFERLGWSVLDTSQLKNCFDILVAKDFYTVAVEIKDGAKPASQRRLTNGESKFKFNWKGAYAVVLSVDDVRNIDAIQKKVTIK